MFFVPRGSDKSWLIDIAIDGAAPDMEGASIVFTAEIDGTTITKRSEVAGGSDDEIEIVDDGQYRVKFEASDTEDLAPRSGICGSLVVLAAEPFAGKSIHAIEADVFVVGPTVARAPA
jgi:hypothetical protein